MPADCMSHGYKAYEEFTVLQGVPCQIETGAEAAVEGTLETERKAE